MTDDVSKGFIKDMRAAYFKLYPDDVLKAAQTNMPLKIFDEINRELGQNFTQ